MKIKLEITDDNGIITEYDLTNSNHLHCILNEHYDSKGRLDGGAILSGGKITGHVDPIGEDGCPGTDGITESFDGIRSHH